jgi:hypothetical protein
MEQDAVDVDDADNADDSDGDKTPPSDMSAKNVKSLENQAGGTASYIKHKREDPKETDTHVGRTPLGTLRHASAYAFLLGLVIIGIGYSAVFAPNIIMVNIKEMYTNDLADATIALYTYDKKLLDFKLKNGQCTDSSIRCKLAHMSRNDVKRYEKAGFKINGSKVKEDNRDDKNFGNDLGESRVKVSSIGFPYNHGTARSADEYDKNANKSHGMKSLVYSVFSPKASFFMDARYKQRIKWRYDLTKGTTVFGATEKEVDKSFDASMKGEAEQIDDTGGGAFSLLTLGDQKGQQGLQKTSMRVGELAWAYVGLQCAYYTHGKIVTNASKKAKQNSIARFAMQYLKAADQIKAGLADEVTANALSSKLAWSNDGSYFKKNATDQKIYKNIVFKEPVGSPGFQHISDNFDVYGKLLPAWLQTVFITQKIVKQIAHISNGNLAQTPEDIGPSARNYCLEGQKDLNKAANKPADCPKLTIGGTPPAMMAAVAPIAQGSDFICPPPPKGIYQMYPISTTNTTMKVVMPYVAGVFNGAVGSWAKESAKNLTSKTKGRDASNAIFSGTGEILGDMAMSRGMRPGNSSSLPGYLNKQSLVYKEFEEVDRYNARNDPFNPYNQYSLVGSLARTITSNYDPNAPLLASLAGVFSLIPSSLSTLATHDANAFYYLQPRKLDPNRLTKCKDAEFLAIGINADIGCNVRYSMSDAELGADPNSVIAYMMMPHPEATAKNIPELAARLAVVDKGLDPYDLRDTTRMLQEAIQGAASPQIDAQSGKPNKFTEYEKFMNYCVDRQDPWGRQGMAVRREALKEEDIEKRLKDKDPDGRPVDPDNDSGDPNEQKVIDAYMSITEGANADQDWYTGKKCLEDSNMLKNFRAYTMLCSVDGSHAGSSNCTEQDRANYYLDGFYSTNDVLYLSWF